MLNFLTFSAEFYLISQSTNQGTVSPTHFHIVHGEKELQADRMQNLTLRLTHKEVDTKKVIEVVIKEANGVVTEEDTMVVGKVNKNQNKRKLFPQKLIFKF